MTAGRGANFQLLKLAGVEEGGWRPRLSRHSLQLLGPEGGWHSFSAGCWAVVAMSKREAHFHGGKSHPLLLAWDVDPPLPTLQGPGACLASGAGRGGQGMPAPRVVGS